MLLGLGLGLLRGSETDGRPALSVGPLAGSTPGGVSCPQEPPEQPTALGAGSRQGQPLPRAAHGSARSRGAATSASAMNLLGLGRKLPCGGGTSAMTSIALLARSCPFKTLMTFSHQQKEAYTSRDQA